MVVVVVLDGDGVLQPVAQLADPGLEQALLVLGGVVFEVLGEVAERARGRDRLDGGRPARALSSASSASSASRWAAVRCSTRSVTR